MRKAAAKTHLLNLEALLDAAPFGRAGIGPSLCFEQPISERAVALLDGEGGRLEGRDVAEVVAARFDIGADAAAQLRDALGVAFDACGLSVELTWDLNVDHLPTELRRGDRARETVVECAWTPLRCEDGLKLESVALSVRDVTQERRLEAALAAERAARPP